MLVSKYCDHLLLYRQSRIFAREGVEVPRSTWAGLVDRTTALLEPLAAATRYAQTRLKRLRSYLEHGFLELDNNAAERALRSFVLGRKNYLFTGSPVGGRAAPIAYTLIETAKINGLDLQAWLADVLHRILEHPRNRIDELPPWNCKPDKALSKAA